MTVEEAVEFFQNVPYLYRKIKVLDEVGLGYITLGQSAVTFKRRRGTTREAFYGVIKAGYRQNILHTR
jgi:hypothetical protein